MYSKFGVNFPYDVITAFFISKHKPCSSIGKFGLDDITFGINCFSLEPKWDEASYGSSQGKKSIAWYKIPFLI